VVPYAIRHTVASELYARDVPENQIAVLLGHKVEGKATRWYVKVRTSRNDYLAEAITALDAWIGRTRPRKRRRQGGGPGVL
jgi:integrase